MIPAKVDQQPQAPAMKTSLGKKIIDRLSEFTETLERGEHATEKFTCRKVVLDLEPTPYDPKLVQKTRAILGASQAIFAKFLGVSVDTVQAWERGDNNPSDIARRFMDEIRHSPKHWRTRFSQVVRRKVEA